MRTVLIATLLVAPLAFAGDAMQLYEIRTETLMPHLEESLRYTTTQEQHCLAERELLTAFAALRHPALAGCRLDADGSSMSYALVCESATRTTGRATWDVGGREWKGVLQVKLGGKNMTFTQRITARAVRPCTPQEFDRKSRSAADGGES